MTVSSATEPVRNPFSTRSVRPGQIPPLDGRGRALDIPALLRTLEARGGSAALVGPHGSGKTTLLWHAAAALEAWGHRVERVRLSDRRAIASLFAAVIRSAGGGIVCIDSWERLWWPCADAVRGVARACGSRLVVTAHRPGRLPTLWKCSTSPELLASIVTRLPGGGGFLSAEHKTQIEDTFRRSAGDIREALFMLYDQFEERTRAVRPTGSAAG